MSGIIDYNMPLTSTYLKQMKLRVMNSQEQVRCLLSPPETRRLGGIAFPGLGAPAAACIKGQIKETLIWSSGP